MDDFIMKFQFAHLYKPFKREWLSSFFFLKKKKKTSKGLWMSAPQKMPVFRKLCVHFRSLAGMLERCDNVCSHSVCVIIGQVQWWLTSKSYSGEFILLLICHFLAEGKTLFSRNDSEWQYLHWLNEFSTSEVAVIKIPEQTWLKGWDVTKNAWLL